MREVTKSDRKFLNTNAPDHFNRAEARAYAGIMLSKRTKRQKFNLLGLRFYPKFNYLIWQRTFK